MDKAKKTFIPNPKETANPLSTTFFFWTLPIFTKGYKRPFEMDDLYETLKKDKSNTIGDTLERHFLEDKMKCNARRKAMGITNPSKGPQPSLLKALAKTFWGNLLFLGIICFSNEMSKLVSPVLLGRLLLYFSPNSAMQHDEALWYAGGIVLLSAASALAMNHYMMGAFHMGMRARVAVCSLIYRKSLKLSRTALGESAPGKVVNLLSNDVNRFDIASVFLHYLWIAPLVSVIVLYFLWYEVGISGLLGILVVFTVVPIQAYTGKLSAKFRLQTAMKTDERVRFMGEIISGVQVIKMYAWEKPFQALITLARRLEIKVIRKNSYVRAVFMTFLLTTTRIAVFFVMLSMVMQGYKLTAARIFVIATYFNLLASTISSMFVRAIAEVAEFMVAIKRLETYLNKEEFDPSRLNVNNNSNNMFNEDLQTKDNVKNSVVAKEGLVSGDDRRDNIAVRISRGKARWDEEKPELTLDIDRLEIKKGKLIGIIGLVGSGKSSLLQAMLGELPLQKGNLEVRGSVSYACQEPWVFGASVRQNIIFGMPYEKARYNEVVQVCALQKDFEQFPFGDQTLVGERGSSLSGGQKARINLARSVYRKADIYLLDDPLSAVDAHVGHELFEKCIMSHLRHRTRLLVTHQLHYLKDADYVVLLQNGKIEMQGTYKELTSSTLQYAQMLVPVAIPEEKELGEEEINRERTNSRSQSRKIGRKRLDSSTSQRNRADSMTSSSMIDINFGMLDDSEDDKEDKEVEEHAEQQIVAEASSRHTVPGSIFLQYLFAGGNIVILLLLISTFFLAQITMSAADFWMAFWTSQEELRDHYKISANNSNESSTDGGNFSEYLLSSASTQVTTLLFEDTSTVNGILQMESLQEIKSGLPDADSLLSTNTCMLIHGLIVAFGLGFTLLRSFSFYNLAMKSSQKLHDMMFRGVVRSPMQFFNENPSGRVMNRFAKDMGSVDELLPKAILDASQVLLQMFGSVILACTVNPYFLIPIVVIGTLFMFVRKIYLKTSKNIKRMEGIAKSPVFTHLNATLQGLTTIRAYGAQDMLKSEFDHLQDVHTSAWYMFITTSSAFGLLLDVMCLVLIIIVTFSFLTISTSILGDKVGLAITQSMSLTFMVQWGIRQSAEVANQLMAVERILEYKLLQPETGIEPDETDKACKTEQARQIMAVKLKKPPREWPEYGHIIFKDLSMKYNKNPDDPYVLKQLCCEIKSHEKVGIVGRTGAGKSSLISALFRLAFNEGAIVIDEIDTADISLTNLRTKISIIPQDPVLFSGTVRRNLDPFEEFSDTELWQSLEAVELKDAITGPAGLESRVMDGGSNFSVGQRQLVCLARALLRKNTILMLDEATANVDPQTDKLIQKTIRGKFEKCTVLTVAHRLNTIMDSDKVLVMDHGRIVEFDHPFILLQKPEGFLTKMVADTGKSTADQLFNVAKENYQEKYSPDDIKMIDE